MKNMILTHSFWSGQANFQMIPIEESCPYNEVIFIPMYKQLVVISKTQKETFIMVDKVDDNGEFVKANKPKQNGKPYKEERRLLKTFTEYYISDENDIINFVNMFALNSDKFDFKSFLKEEDERQIETLKKDIISPKGEILIENK